MRSGSGTGSTGLNFLLGDHLGSTTVATDANGTNPIRHLYKPWGETRYTSASLPTTFRYTGQRETTVGLYFYQSRFYDPYITQFTQPNPIIQDPYNSLDWNRYAYVRFNPINFSDPTGYDVDCGAGDAGDPGCHTRIANERRAAYFKAEAERCATEGGENCPDYVGLTLFTIGFFALPGPDEIGMGVDAGLAGWEAAQNYILLKGAQCTADPTCRSLLYFFLGVQSAPTKPSSNDIGTWGAEQVGKQLPVDVRQIRVFDPITGRLRIYDGQFTNLPGNFVEIKTSLAGVVNAGRFIRNQISIDASMSVKPTWLFVNAHPSGPLMRLLQQAGIPWTQLNVPWP